MNFDCACVTYCWTWTDIFADASQGQCVVTANNRLYGQHLSKKCTQITKTSKSQINYSKRRGWVSVYLKDRDTHPRGHWCARHESWVTLHLILSSLSQSPKCYLNSLLPILNGVNDLFWCDIIRLAMLKWTFPVYFRLHNRQIDRNSSYLVVLVSFL